ncbi:hypothetical protein C8R43DRAFT_819884, partial [Mycena crocata]
PSLGSWVVLTIDPIATLEELDDPDALISAEKLTPKPYVAFVKIIHEMYLASQPFHSYSIHFLLRGPPRDHPEDFIEASMSVPVLPTSVEHPLSRQPLRPSNPLPWENCYLSPFVTANVRCPT